MNSNSIDDTFVIGSNGGKKKKLIKFIKNKTEIFIKSFFSSNTLYSIGLISSMDRKIIEEISPDIINLHWICGTFISIKDMEFLSKYKIVWTLHDSWAFTGGCHIPYECKKYILGCNKCEQLASNHFFDITRYIFKEKKLYYRLDGLECYIVTPSNWLKNCAQNSLLFKDKEIVNIGNCLNVQEFKPLDKKFARDILNIKCNKKIITFGAVKATSDNNKGFEYLQKAIKYLHDNAIIDDLEIVIFGSNEPRNKPDFGYKTKYIGHLYDDTTLNILYTAADVTIVPSKSENLPNVIMESMASGTPCVAFNIGGISDMIEHRINGYLAEPYKTVDLANGIKFILEDKRNWDRLSINARNKIVANYSMDVIANKYKELYNKIFDLIY